MRAWRLLHFPAKLCKFERAASNAFSSIMCSVKSPTKFLLLAIACIFLSRNSVSQNIPDKGEAAGITVQGRVLLDPQQLPVKKANIQLLGARVEGPYSAVADNDGHFVIDGVKAGRYVIRVEHPGLSATGSPRTLNVVSQGTGELVLHMRPAAVITGKITDADGDPLRDVNVMATRAGSSHGRFSHDTGYGNTNDLGEFRIPDLRPGRYTLLATPRRDLQIVADTKPAQGENRLVNVATYYPGTLDKNQAASVDVEAGQETPVNFAVLTSRAFHVSGDVVGLAASNIAQIMLMSDQGSMDAEQQLQTGGKFEFVNLLPGNYRVRIVTFSLGNGQSPNTHVLGVNRTIEVTSGDVRDVHLQVDQGASVRGHFRIDSGEQFDWTQLTVVLAGGDENSGLLMPSNGSPPTFSTVAKDGTFEMKTVPSGRYHLVVGARGSSNKLRDYFTKSIMLNGQDVGDSGFEVNSATELQVVISAKGATIEGTAVDEKGNPVSSVTVVDVPDGDRRLRPDLYQQDITDERGHFSLRGLNPGSYTVLAFEDLEDSPQDAAFLTSYGSKGEKVSVDEGGDKRLVLKVISASSDDTH